MTKFILHGGQVSVKVPENDKFFQQFTQHVNKPEVKILLCYWSRPKVQWLDLLKRDGDLIKAQTNKQIILTVVKNPTDLIEKLPQHDVLYVAGGDAEPIEKLLPQLKDLTRHLKNKIYLGSSMGAFIVAKKYVLSHDAQDSRTVHTGLGIIPKNILCHWDQEPHQVEKIKLLQTADPTTEIIKLNETEWVSFSQD